MPRLNAVSKQLLAALLLAGLALLVLSCSRPTPAAPVATVGPAATALPTTQPAVQPTIAATANPLPTPASGGSPLPAPDTSTSPLQSPGAYTAVVVVQRSGGLAGVSEQWSVYRDGRILTPKGTQSQVSAAEVSSLLTALDKAGFFTLKDSYGQGTQCRDCYNYQLSVNSDGRSKTVSFVEGDNQTPPALTASLKAINDLLNQTAR